MFSKFPLYRKQTRLCRFCISQDHKFINNKNDHITS